MRCALFFVAFLLVAFPAEAAPAPVYKDRPSLESAHRALPKPLRDQIESAQRGRPELIDAMKRDIRFARTETEKVNRLAQIERWKAQHYCYPIDHLEYQRQQPAYQSRENQQKIEEALKFYRRQYVEAKKKGPIKLPNSKE